THASPVTIQPRRQPTQTSSASAADADVPPDLNGSGAGQFVYFFGPPPDGAEGTREMKRVLGGTGANLAEMTHLGVPVPPGFTIACAACVRYLHDGSFPESLKAEVEEHLKRLEGATARKFGDASNPLLVSVRSGAPVSMPGMMETILNLGL